MKVILRGGEVVDPWQNRVHRADVLLEDGRVAAVEARLPARGARVLDVTGQLLLPGLIDLHVHLREPGYEYKEDIASGTAAAVRGGFTAVACMPNTNPVADNLAVLELIKARAREAGLARVYPVAAITKGSQGEELVEMAELAAGGAVAFSDDGQPVRSAAVMRRALQYAGMLGRPIISHCEDKELAAGGVMHEGYVSTRLGLKGIPAAAEEVMVARDIILCELTGSPLHLTHVSTAGSVRLIREAKKRGLPVTADATPHHFTLTHSAVEGYDTSTKVNPPLRSAEDVAAVRQGLAEGTIDAIATDHAPHARQEKEVEYDLAPFGIIGLETALALVWTELVLPGHLDVLRAAARMAAAPADILHLPVCNWQPGCPADITVFDPAAVWVVDPDRLASKSRNTPFAGRRLQGRVTMTIVEGRVVYSATEAAL
ncbi:MAG: dihydroorotase [Desulfurispora sp.]|uniref:dihydroorotase n=1 Tax=Desulfurispora sp. TaxID=3014275 RepID=UPI00404B7C1C